MEDTPKTLLMDKKQALLVVAGLVILALIAWAFVFSRKSSKEQSEETVRTVKTANEGIERVVMPSTVEVPTSVNPVKQVLPDENPIDKANPFNKVYKNPFDE